MSRRILDLQARFTEAGRIRLGKKLGNRPSKIDKLRFTSPSEDLIQQISELYGGEVTQWRRENLDTQWQVFIDRDEIDIIIPPGDESLTTAYEVWTAAGMQKYCDGNVMKFPGSDDEYSCECQYGSERTCKIKARMLVWLPRIQTLGVWRLETGSWYAAGELTRMVDLLLSASEHLHKAIGAKLRLDKRTVKRGGKTFNFNVPIITPVGDVAVVLEAMTPMTALPEARDVDMQPVAPPAIAPPAPTKWPLDEPEPDESAPEAPEDSETISKGKHSQLMITLRAINYTDSERHDLVKHVTNGRTESSKELTDADMSEIWERVTARCITETQQRFNILFREPSHGWDTLHDVTGLSIPVKQWKLKEWLIALDYCERAVESMNTEAEVQN